MLAYLLDWFQIFDVDLSLHLFKVNDVAFSLLL